MSSESRARLIVVDDDPGDALLVKTAVRRTGLPLQVLSLPDGEALMHHLTGTERLPQSDPMVPALIIFLDLNMPRKDGRACLRELKSDPRFSDIPIIVFSTSNAVDDIEESYRLHANAYICKPDDLRSLEKTLNTVYRYWLSGSATYQ